MYTAMLSVENIYGADHDVWSVNVEEEYHEVADSPTRDRRTGRGAQEPVATRPCSRGRRSTRPRHVATEAGTRDPSPRLHADLHRGGQHLGAAAPGARRRCPMRTSSSSTTTARTARRTSPRRSVPRSASSRCCAARRSAGSATRTGPASQSALARDYDIVVQIDADLSHDPAVLPQLIAAVERGADLAIGSRYVPGGVDAVLAVAAQGTLEATATCYAGFMLRTDVQDDNSAGFRAFRADTLKAVEYATTRAKGYGFQIELTYRVAHSGGTHRRGADHVHRPGARPVEDVDGVMVEEMTLISWWGSATGCACSARSAAASSTRRQGAGSASPGPARGCVAGHCPVGVALHEQLVERVAGAVDAPLADEAEVPHEHPVRGVGADLARVVRLVPVVPRAREDRDVGRREVRAIPEPFTFATPGSISMYYVAGGMSGSR